MESGALTRRALDGERAAGGGDPVTQALEARPTREVRAPRTVVTHVDEDG